MGQCEFCEYGKAMCKPTGNVHKSKGREHFGDEMHMDSWGPSNMQTPGHKILYVSFTDDYMCYTHLYLLVAKSDTLDTYCTYSAWVKTQHSTIIKQL